MEVAANEEVENAFVDAVPSVDGELGAPKSDDLSAMPPDEDSAIAKLTVEEVMSQLQVRRAYPTESASSTAEKFSNERARCGP